MIMSKSRMPFTGYSRLLQRQSGGTFTGYGQEWAPPDYNDPRYWQVPAQQTTTGVPYYLAAPGSTAGGETQYVDAGSTQAAGAGTSAAGGSTDWGGFFTSLVSGILGGIGGQKQQPAQQPMYYPPPQPQGVPGWLIGAGVVLGAGTLYVLLKK